MESENPGIWPTGCIRPDWRMAHAPRRLLWLFNELDLQHEAFRILLRDLLFENNVFLETSIQPGACTGGSSWSFRSPRAFIYCVKLRALWTTNILVTEIRRPTLDCRSVMLFYYQISDVSLTYLDDKSSARTAFVLARHGPVTASERTELRKPKSTDT